MSVIEAKIVVLGSTGVGKTSIVVRYLGNGFNKHVSPTIGASFFTCKVAIDSYRVKLQVWDTAGQERFRSMAPMYYRKANAALLVFDITSKDSYEDMKSWIHVMCVVGNKSDLAADRAITKDLAVEYANSINALYFETSAVSNEGIEDVFMYIAKALIDDHESRKEEGFFRRGTAISRGIAVHDSTTQGSTDQATGRACGC